MAIVQERVIAVVEIALKWKKQLDYARAIFQSIGNDYMARACEIDSAEAERIIRESEHFKHVRRDNEKRALANHRRRYNLNHEDAAVRQSALNATPKPKGPIYTPAEREELHHKRMKAMDSRYTDKEYHDWNNGRGSFAQSQEQKPRQGTAIFQRQMPTYTPKSSGVHEDGSEWSFGESEELDPTKLVPGQDLF